MADHWKQDAGTKDTHTSHPRHAAPQRMPQAREYTQTHYELPDDRRRHHRSQKGKPRRSKAPAVLGALLIVCLAIYAFGCFWFAGHMLPGTSVGGHDLSGMDAASAASTLASASEDFMLTATDAQNTGTIEISGADADFTYDGHAAAESLLAQQSAFSWPAHAAGAALLGRTWSYVPEGAASWNADALASAVRDAISAYNADSATAPVDAHLSWDKEQASFVVAAETEGTELDEAACLPAIEQAFESLNSHVVFSGDAYTKPQVLSTDERLASAIPAANALMGAQITVTLSGSTVYTADDDVVAQWISLDDSFTPTLTEDTIKAWAEKNYDTAGTTRTFTDYKGETRTVVCNDNPETESTYGQIVDADAFASAAYAAAMSKATATIDLPVTQEAASFAGAGKQDWGERYIDVDITNQHAALVDKGQVLWESDVVTGNVAAGNDTPQGVFQITNKYNSITLVGEDASQSFVYNWMGFIRSTWGLHDATWRSEFGGDIYKTNGSHGCVNLPLEAANELYQLVQVGDVVVVHA